MKEKKKNRIARVRMRSEMREDFGRRRCKIREREEETWEHVIERCIDGGKHRTKEILRILDNDRERRMNEEVGRKKGGGRIGRKEGREQI